MVSAAVPQIRPRRPREPVTALIIVACLFASVGAALPLAMMLHGAIAEGLVYETWTWAAIPFVWLLALSGGAVATRYRSLGALILAFAAGSGLYAFRPEYGLYTFGPVWLLAAALYLDAVRLSYRREPSPSA